ncbi:hypothetical protein RhiirC2_804329 [Rhizophagus irregularis]|uniref:Uncharacterized protein n=1 Tax=Rhizophagus irregularis TaxID=588596 RepID=A0A2N1L1E3_9GLOM|nr:hypothetical protein RhiirC2_804329 [Rhizophagus irregularis]
MSRATKTLDNSKKSANKRGEDIIRQFLSELLRTKSNKQPEDDYNYDSVDNITDSMAGMTLNSATINAINSAVKVPLRKNVPSVCSQKKKKKSKKSKKSKVNLAIEPDSDSSSNDTSSSDSSDSDTSSSDSSDSDSHWSKSILSGTYRVPIYWWLIR